MACQNANDRRGNNKSEEYYLKVIMNIYNMAALAH